MKLHTLTATELKRHLDSREISSVELVRALLDRIDAVDGRIRAFVHRFDKAALEQAEKADAARTRGDELGPLHGMPISLKESVGTVGLDVTLGMRNFIGRKAAKDAIVARLLKEAGAIVIGKTNIPQTQLAIETTNSIWGTTVNPWNTLRVPGGSSGGEGAALASGCSVLGIGTDIGGSIRTPANFCGIAGLKPTEHRWSNAGIGTAIMGQETIRSQIGPMARTSADVALLFEAIPSALHSQYDPFAPPVPVLPSSEVDVSKLKIGWYIDDTIMTCSRAVRRAVHEAIEHLKAAGASVEEYSPPSQEEIAYMYFRVLTSDGGATVRESLGGEEPIHPLKLMIGGMRVPKPARLAAAKALHRAGEHRLASVAEQSGPHAVEELWKITGRRAQLRFQELETWAERGFDAIICPAFPTAAMEHEKSRDVILGAEYAMRYNLLNLPAGVAPVTQVRSVETARIPVGKPDRIEQAMIDNEAGSKGMPIGVQVVGKPYAEHVVLALMQAIEAGAREQAEFPETPVDP